MGSNIAMSVTQITQHPIVQSVLLVVAAFYLNITILWTRPARVAKQADLQFQTVFYVSITLIWVLMLYIICAVNAILVLPFT